MGIENRWLPLQPRGIDLSLPFRLLLLLLLLPRFEHRVCEADDVVPFLLRIISVSMLHLFLPIPCFDKQPFRKGEVGKW